MARQTFRLNLLAAKFPLLSDNYGRSVVHPVDDMHYQRPNVFSGEEADSNIGIPQLIFCENVMPMSAGIQSVGYTLAVNPSGSQLFDSAFYLRDSSDNRTLFSPGVSGTTANRYTYNATSQLWASSPVAVPSGAKCTVANIKSRTIVKFAFDTNFYEWNGAWSVFTVPALVPANIMGVVAANSYLICYDRNTIYWSATSDITDFVPSLITGAGSQRALAVKGDIVVCYPIDDGFIIYTTQNVVIARYSNNARFPWNYKEVKNSAGTLDPEHACAAGEGNNYYQFSTNGLMVNTLSKSEQKFPIVNEFLGQRVYETWNKATYTLTRTVLNAPFLVKIQFVANRWFVISYGATLPYSFALVYDTALQRWGKLKIDHMDCFEFYGNVGVSGSSQNLTWQQLVGTWVQQIGPWADYGTVLIGGASSLTVPYKSLGFLQKDGGVRVVNFDLANVNDDAIAIIGRIQYLRDRLWQILEVDAEGMGAETQTKLMILTTLDGMNYAKKVFPYKKINSGRLQKWLPHESGLNHSLAFMGNFDLTTVIARGKLLGKR